MDELTRRLDALERRNRWLARTVTLMALALVGLLAVGWKSPDGTVEATKFVVKDKDVKTCAELGAADDGSSSLTFFSDGNTRAALNVRAGGAAGFGLADREGHVLATMDVVGDGLPSLSLSDNEGNVRAKLSAAANGTPSIGLYDKDGKSIWRAPSK